jgi:hypothetical protein
MWCWVRSTWPEIRLATFYAPIWFAIICTLTIYAITGRKILRSQRELKRFSEFARRTKSGNRKGHTNSQNNNMELSATGSEAITLSSASNNANAIGETGEKDHGLASVSSRHLSHDAEQVYQSRDRSAEAHRVAFAYAQCAMLFFVALLVTWV